MRSVDLSGSTCVMWPRFLYSLKTLLYWSVNAGFALNLLSNWMNLTNAVRWDKPIEGLVFNSLWDNILFFPSCTPSVLVFSHTKIPSGFHGVNCVTMLLGTWNNQRKDSSVCKVIVVHKFCLCKAIKLKYHIKNMLYLRMFWIYVANEQTALRSVTLSIYQD